MKILSQHLHIVCSDAPWPADCGSAIDILNRIRMFHKYGIYVHLHYFTQREHGEPKELKAICHTIQSYKRATFTHSISFNIPQIVSSHTHNGLVAELQKDNYPILLEGLHTTGVLSKIDISKRKVCVRLRHDEALHFIALSRVTAAPHKKIYYAAQSLLIRRYSKLLPKNISYACASEADSRHLQQYGLQYVYEIPTFPTWQETKCSTGVGHLCLFHGNLSEPENEKAAFWLLCHVFNNVRVPFIIAGKKPSVRLKKAATLCQHTCLVSDPSVQELNDLIQKAHINILPFLSRNVTGGSLKLLHALYQGRHCVVTPGTVYGTGLEAACHIGHNATDLASIISELYYQPFEERDIATRKQLLTKYDNEKNIRAFTNLLW